MIGTIKINTIEAYLVHTPSEQLPIVERLRKLITSTIPEVEERILWSTPWYYLNKKPLVYIATSSDHVNFGFGSGAHLKSELLEGTGKNMRHIKLRSLEDIQKHQQEFVSLLHEATDLLIYNQ